MANIADVLGDVIKGDNLVSLSNMLGIDQGATKKGIVGAATALISSLAQKTSQPGGSAGVLSLLTEAGDSGILDNVGAYLSNGNISGGLSVLQNIFGGNLSGIMTQIAKSSKISEGIVGQFLPLVTPVILASLGKLVKSENLSVDQLSKFLKDQEGFVRTLSPGLIGFLERIDANDDGSILDDLGRLADRFFGGRK